MAANAPGSREAEYRKHHCKPSQSENQYRTFRLQMHRPNPCYNRGMDAADVIAYKNRWREVERVERIEAQEASINDRWLQLNSIISLALALGLFSTTAADQEEIVWRRWADLKQLGGS